MTQALSAVSLLVPDYDAGIDYYVGVLGFTLLEDTGLGEGKRWVRVSPSGDSETALLLAQADSPDQIKAIGQQAGGRVFLFLRTDDFARDHAKYSLAGVNFLEEVRHELYGSVVVFQDPFGNKWDLIEPKAS
jgi:catechol 2,3-dioxygenase-like lactoylglutathione lyase family enzyme